MSELSGLCVTSTKFQGRPALHFSVSGGCSCEFLAEGAQPHEAVWDLDAENRAKLAHALAVLAKESGVFSFIAHWLGLASVERTEECVGAKQLVELISSNRLKNNTIFHVGHAG